MTRTPAWARQLVLSTLLASLLSFSCDGGSGETGDADGAGDGDIDSDGDADSDGDVDSDADADGDTDGGDDGGDGDGDADGSEIDFTGRNTGTVLEGDSFPAGGAAIDELRKVVPVALLAGGELFAAEEAFIARRAADATDAFYAMIPIENVSSRPYCFVTVGANEYLDGSDSVVAESSFWDVTGSVGRSGSVFTPTCLAPGEVGTFAEVQLFVDFAVVARVELALDADPDTDIHEPLSAPTPTGYAYDSVDGLTVEVRNDGSSTAALSHLSSAYLLLDEAGDPLWFHILRTPAEPADLVLEPGATGVLLDPSVHYEGTGQGIQVFLWWSDQL